MFVFNVLVVHFGRKKVLEMERVMVVQQGHLRPLSCAGHTPYVEFATKKRGNWQKHGVRILVILTQAALLPMKK